ncbi:MAG: ATPase P [Anaerolineae bacterium]|nr:ATPase P [Anaerolineae bacterium]
MIQVEVPGYGTVRIEHLVLDYNGTIAFDGTLIPGVKEALAELAEQIEVHVITADTFGGARDNLAGVPCTLSLLPPSGQTEAKCDYVCQLGAAVVAAIGNGRNDRLMLQKAALGIVVVQEEGAAVETLLAARIVCPDIVHALELLLHPLRLKATLRA